MLRRLIWRNAILYLLDLFPLVHIGNLLQPCWRLLINWPANQRRANMFVTRCERPTRCNDSYVKPIFAVLGVPQSHLGRFCDRFRRLYVFLWYTNRSRIGQSTPWYKSLFVCRTQIYVKSEKPSKTRENTWSEGVFAPKLGVESFLRLCDLHIFDP